MGAFVARGDVKEVHTAIRKQLGSQKFEVGVDLNLSSPTLVATNRSGSLWQNMKAHIQLEPYEDVVLIDAKFQLGLLHRIALLILSTYKSTIFILFILYVEEFALAVLDVVARVGAYFIGNALGGISDRVLTDLPKCHLVLAVALGAAFPAFILYYRLGTEGSRVLTKTETEFWGSLKKIFPLRLMALAKLRAHPADITGSIVIAVVISGGIMLFRICPWLLVCWFPLLFLLGISLVTPLLYERQSAIYPKAVIVQSSVIITCLSSQILLLLTACFLISAAYGLSSKSQDSEKAMTISDLRQYLNDDKNLIGENCSVSEIMQGLSTKAGYWAEKIIQKVPRVSEKKTDIEKMFILAYVSPVVGMACAILLFSIFLGSLMVGLPLLWQNYAGKDEIDWIRLPAEVESKGARSKSFRIIIFLISIMAAVLNTFTLLAAIDAVWFVLSGHALLFPQIQALLTWVFIPFLTVGELTNTQGLWIWDSLARFVIMIVGLPPLIIAARRILTVCYDFIRRLLYRILCLFSRWQVPKSLTLHVNNICHEHGIQYPMVIRIPDKTVHLSVSPSFVGGRPVIWVSDGAIAQLTEAEIKAAVAHELAHVKQRIEVLHLLKTIAILCGQPPWFLMLLVDFRKLEEDADRFALCVGEDPFALARAIVKASTPKYPGNSRTVSILSTLRKRTLIPNPILKAFRLVLIIDRFLFTDELVGFSHPLPRDRIATILANTKVVSGTAC